MNKFILYLVAPLTICYSCNKAETEWVDNPGDGKTNVEFSTTVTGEPFDSGNGGYTRAFDNVWEQGDQVGIYMYNSQLGLVDLTLATNRKYTANVAGKLYSDNQNKIQIEEEDPEVDFVAYYPYKENIDNYLYSLDITDQQDQAALDFLFAKTAVGYTTHNLPVNLAFDHKMTKLVFNVTSDGTITNFKAVLKGAVHEADFLLVDGSYESGVSGNDITLKSTVNGNTVTVEGIVFPERQNAQGKEVIFYINGKEATWTVPAGTIWKSGVKLKYNVNITGIGAEVTENYGWFETPLKTSIDNTVFLTYELPDPARAAVQRNYSMLYDTEYKVAHWVAYPMCDFYTGDADRYTGYWLWDEILPHSQQPDVRTGSWPDSNYDRGHQIARSDRNTTKEENRSTFYMTNQTAQWNSLNQGVWETLESTIRDKWMPTCDTLYVVTGAMITTPDDQNIQYIADRSGNLAALPKYYYKALAQVSFDSSGQITQVYTAGFRMPNRAPSSSDIQTYITTVKELEEFTGFTFFPQLSETDKGALVNSRWPNKN